MNRRQLLSGIAACTLAPALPAVVGPSLAQSPYSIVPASALYLDGRYWWHVGEQTVFYSAVCYPLDWSPSVAAQRAAAGLDQSKSLGVSDG